MLRSTAVNRVSLYSVYAVRGAEGDEVQKRRVYRPLQYGFETHMHVTGIRDDPAATIDGGEQRSVW
jgi:hypothetical protein